MASTETKPTPAEIIQGLRKTVKIKLSKEEKSDMFDSFRIELGIGLVLGGLTGKLIRKIRSRG